MYVSNPCGGQYEIHTKLLHRSPYSSFLGSVKVRYKWKQIHWWLMRCWDILISELRYYLLKKQPFECDMQFFESIAMSATGGWQTAQRRTDGCIGWEQNDWLPRGNQINLSSEATVLVDVTETTKPQGRWQRNVCCSGATNFDIINLPSFAS